MKQRSLILILLVLVFAIAGFGQSVVITGKKVTYKRPKPESEYKKSFTINYPKVKASTPALSKKIESTIGYQKVLDLNLKDEIGDLQWLEEADYEVGYNKNGVLSISLWMEGSAAYPSDVTRIIVVDLRTGNRAKIADIFTDIAGLTALVKKVQKKEVAAAIIDIKKDPDNGDVAPEDLFSESAKYSPFKLDEFSVTDKGVTFHYDYGFVHAVLALQPSGEYFYTWQQLKPYIKRGGLLGRFVR